MSDTPKSDAMKAMAAELGIPVTDLPIIKTETNTVSQEEWDNVGEMYRENSPVLLENVGIP